MSENVLLLIVLNGCAAMQSAAAVRNGNKKYTVQFTTIGSSVHCENDYSKDDTA